MHPISFLRIRSGSILGDMYYVLGNAYLETEDYGDAVLNLEEAIRANTENSLYYRDYAIALAKTGNTEQAEAVLETSCGDGPWEKTPFIWCREKSHLPGADYPGAEENLSKVIQYAEAEDLRKRAVLLCDRVYRELGADYLDQESRCWSRRKADMEVSGVSEQLDGTPGRTAYVRKAEAEEGQSGAYYSMALEKFEGLYESGYVTRQLMENIAIVYEQLMSLTRRRRCFFR